MSLNPVEPRKVKSKHLPLINVCQRGWLKPPVVKGDRVADMPPLTAKSPDKQVFPVSSFGARFYQRTISERARARQRVGAGQALAGGTGPPAR